MIYYFEVLKKFAFINSRAGRAEFWYFTLISAIISIFLMFVDLGMGNFNEETGNGLLGTMYAFAVFIPSIAVAVRRIHDSGKSGWFYLVPFYNLYLLIKEGDLGLNKYGSNSKYPDLEDDIIDHLVE
jgi:uncharacterized membrane protein YhaH (DUF805 family)